MSSRPSKTLLTPLRFVDKKDSFEYWEYKCACGNTCVKRSTNVLAGSTKSCGCLHGGIKANEVFGRLTVLEKSRKGKHFFYYKCRCECGNITEVLSNNLKSGRTKSCGCLNIESRKKKRNRKRKGGKNV